MAYVFVPLSSAGYIASLSLSLAAVSEMLQRQGCEQQARARTPVYSERMLPNSFSFLKPRVPSSFIVSRASPLLCGSGLARETSSVIDLVDELQLLSTEWKIQLPWSDLPGGVLAHDILPTPFSELRNPLHVLVECLCSRCECTHQPCKSSPSPLQYPYFLGLLPVAITTVSSQEYGCVSVAIQTTCHCSSEVGTGQ